MRLFAKVDCQTQSSREGRDRKQCWYYKKIFNLNLLVWRHFPISSVRLFMSEWKVLRWESAEFPTDVGANVLTIWWV